MAQTVDEYMQSMQQQTDQAQQGVFEVSQDNVRILRVNMGIPSSSTGQVLSQVRIMTKSMVAYEGDISFHREGLREQGLYNTFMQDATHEGGHLTKATANGRAQLILAHEGKQVTIFKLQGDSIVVNGNRILAFEPTVRYEIKMMKSISSMASGGLFNVTLTGYGMVAIVSHGRAISLSVGPRLPPVFTHPHATVAWSSHLFPEFKVNTQWSNLVGRGTGESFQMMFDGNRSGAYGFVLVQPYEEVPPPPASQGAGAGGPVGIIGLLNNFNN